jgi:hypothetical protein
MAHYATLNEYQFDEDIADIRGSKMYGEGGQDLGRVRDVVFDHSSGDIEYLVVDNGHERRVLVPVNRVYRTVTDEDSFSSDLTAEDLEHMPAFDEKVLRNDRQWRDYRKLHEGTLPDRKMVDQEYKREWVEDPVQNRPDAPAHDITPTPDEMSSNVTPINRGRMDDYVPDLTPQRLAPVFGATQDDSEKLEMVPQVGHSRGPAAGYISAGLGAKWEGFAEQIKRDLHEIRGKCERCEERDSRAA